MITERSTAGSQLKQNTGLLASADTACQLTIVIQPDIGIHMLHDTFAYGSLDESGDGTLIVDSAGRYRNLWLDTGRGTLGWTMAAGSGRLIADLISEKRPNIEYEDLALERHG